MIANLEGGGTLTSKDGLEGASNTMGKRELKLRIDELLDVGTTNLGSRELGDLDDVDRAETGTVASSQILVYTTRKIRLMRINDASYSKT